MPPPIHILDLQFLNQPHGIASYLIRGPAGNVLIESGPGSTLAGMHAALARHGLQPADIGDILLTHIHLDHAGAAGWWAEQGARIHVHHLGAPHLIEPARLLASARRIYGADMDRLWGQFVPVSAHKVYAHHDADVIEVGGLRFIAHDTPGHARHHLVYALDDIAFTGDLTAIRLIDVPHVRLATPPPEFEPEVWLDSIARMRALNFSRIYLTHFGPRDNVSEHWDTTANLLPQYAERVRAGLERGLDRDALLDDLQLWEEARLRADAVPTDRWPTFAGLAPVSMNLSGLLRYWRQQGLGQ